MFEGVIKETQGSRTKARGARAVEAEVESPVAVPIAIPVDPRGSVKEDLIEPPGQSDRRTVLTTEDVRGNPSSGAATVANTLRLLDMPAVSRVTLPMASGGTRLCEVHLSQHIDRMCKDGVHHATIRLSPEGLGELDIRLTLEGSRVSVEFGSPLESTRGLLEQAIPRLSELLSQGGLTLNQTSVLSAISKEGWVTLGRPLLTLERMPVAPEASVNEETTVNRPGRRRLLDLYA